MSSNPADPEPRPDSPNEGRRRLITWLWRLPVLVVIGGAGYAAYEAVRIFNKGKPSETPEFISEPPQQVAPLNAFQNPWDQTDFVYEGVPAVAMRVPEPVAGGLSVEGGHYAAFSRICTHQGCVVALNRNTEAIAVAYNYRTDAPALVCNCHFSVFDVTKAGEAVSGPAVEPLPRIQLRAQDGLLYAVGVETQT